MLERLQNNDSELTSDDDRSIDENPNEQSGAMGSDYNYI